MVCSHVHWASYFRLWDDACRPVVCLQLGRLPWARHHRYQGQVLLPASAYCVMALDAARVLLGGREASVIEIGKFVF